MRETLNIPAAPEGLPPSYAPLEIVCPYFDTHPEKLEEAFASEENLDTLEKFVNTYLNNLPAYLPGARRRSQFEKYKIEEGRPELFRAIDAALAASGFPPAAIHEEMENINDMKSYDEATPAKVLLMKRLVAGGFYRALRAQGLSHHDIVG